MNECFLLDQTTNIPNLLVAKRYSTKLALPGSQMHLKG